MRFLSDVLVEFYKTGRTALLDGYSDRCLSRVWKAQRFSWWTGLTHRFPEASPYERRIQLGSKAAQTTLAENHVVLPIV